MNRKISREAICREMQFALSIDREERAWCFRFSSCARYRSCREEYRECFEFSEFENCAGFDPLIDNRRIAELVKSISIK